MRKKNSTAYSRRRFHNEVLGESYGGDDIPITIAMMEECAKNEFKLGQLGDKEKIFCGIDWGAKSYLWIHNKYHRLIDLAIADNADPREHPKVFARQIAKYKKYVKKVWSGPVLTYIIYVLPFLVSTCSAAILVKCSIAISTFSFCKYAMPDQISQGFMHYVMN